MKTKIWFFWGNTVAILFAAVGYVCGLSPMLTFVFIFEAINNKDVVSLSNNIDFPTLQNNLKGQFRYHIQKQQTNSEDIWFNMGLEIGKLFRSYFVDKLIEDNINATSFANSYIANGNYANINYEQIEFKHDNLSTFSANIDGGKIRYVLTRKGLDWDLTNIIFSESLY